MYRLFQTANVRLSLKQFFQISKKLNVLGIRPPKRILASKTGGKKHGSMFIPHKWQKLFIQTYAIWP